MWQPTTKDCTRWFKICICTHTVLQLNILHMNGDLVIRSCSINLKWIRLKKRIRSKCLRTALSVGKRVTQQMCEWGWKNQIYICMASRRRLITVAGGDRCYSMTINSNKLEGRIKTLLVLTMLILHTQIASIMVALMSLQLQISRFQYAWDLNYTLTPHTKSYEWQCLKTNYRQTGVVCMYVGNWSNCGWSRMCLFLGGSLKFGTELLS